MTNRQTTQQHKLPAGWQEVELRDICEVKKGSSITRDKITDGDVPVIAGGQQPAYYHNTSNRTGETLTVSGSGAYAGFVAYFNIPIFASDCSTIQSRENKVFMRYIYYFLKGNQKQIYKMQKGIAQPHVYPKDLAKIKIPLPPLPTQKHIVQILEKAEKLKQKREEADDKTGKYLKSVFYERFNPYFINENLKRISELCEVKGGKRVPKGEQFSVEKTSRPYLRVTDMTNKSINKEDLRFLSEGIFYLIKNYTISKDDVYISIAGTIGAVGTIPKDLDGASLTENAAKLVIKNKRELDKIYLSYVFEHNLIKNQIKKRICAVGVPKLAIFRIEDIQIPLPPLPLQQKFAKIVEKVEKLKEKQKESKEKIDEMFNSLMSKAFKGELA